MIISPESTAPILLRKYAWCCGNYHDSFVYFIPFSVSPATDKTPWRPFSLCCGRSKWCCRLHGIFPRQLLMSSWQMLNYPEHQRKQSQWNSYLEQILAMSRSQLMLCLSTYKIWQGRIMGELKVRDKGCHNYILSGIISKDILIDR